MIQAGIIGHFAFGKESCSGQVIKTRIVAQELQRELTEDQVACYDTHGGWRFLLRLPVVAWRAVRGSRNVIMMPAYSGIHFITPAISLFNLLLHRRLHYIVIGGWLPGYMKRFPLLRAMLKRFSSIYVETTAMKEALQRCGMNNVVVMPNFKPLNIVSEEQLPPMPQPPYRLCTFSRVMKEKGIEDAVNAVKTCNERHGATVFTLDIYGQVQQPEWFERLMNGQPDSIRYCGTVPFDKTTDTLKDYFALLFPTYYKGEAYAGTLIDAMASALPVIASDWHANPEIVDDRHTGLLFPTHSVEKLTEILNEIAANPERLYDMRSNCIRKARLFQPQEVIQTLLSNLD